MKFSRTPLMAASADTWKACAKTMPQASFAQCVSTGGCRHLHDANIWHITAGACDMCPLSARQVMPRIQAARSFSEYAVSRCLCLQLLCYGYLLSSQECCNKVGFARCLLSIQLQQTLPCQLCKVSWHLPISILQYRHGES